VFLHRWAKWRLMESLISNIIMRLSLPHRPSTGYSEDRWMYAYMIREPQARLTITLSKQTDLALRSYLGTQGMKKGDLSKFIEEAVRWRIFHQTVQQARAAFADVPPDDLDKMIREAVEEVRAKRYRERSERS
jgi:Ribbon-helix-helix domain